MQQSALPGADTWWDRYGAIGVVAFIAIMAGIAVGKMLLNERARDRDDEKRRISEEHAARERERAEQQARIDRDRAEQQARVDRELATARAAIDAREKTVADLNAKLLEVVQASHVKTLELLEKQRIASDERYEGMIEAWRESKSESNQLAAAAIKAVESIYDKLKLLQAQEKS